MKHGRETANDRAARVWSTVQRGAAAYRSSDARRQTDFWHNDQEEKAYLAGYIAGTAKAQVDAEKAWEQGYAEAIARLGQRTRYPKT